MGAYVFHWHPIPHFDTVRRWEGLIMRYWVQFLQHPLKAPDYVSIDHSRWIDATGDRSVFILDGRNSQETMRTDALKQAQRMEHWEKYPAFQLCKGDRLFNETKRGPMQRIVYPVNI